jgi:hypothetical protein
VSGEGRRAYLDRSPGEERAVVTVGGRPERLLIAREDDATPRIGARYLGRVEAVSERMGLARLELGGVIGAMRLRRDLAVHVGQKLELEVVAEPVRGKPAQLRALSAGVREGSPGRLAPGPTLVEQLRAQGLADPVRGEEAREAADDAQAAALATTHLLPGGVDLAIETTRALTAVDVDLAEGGVSPGRANLEALPQIARLLRLKAIGGLVAIDLVGFPKPVRDLLSAAQAAFAPDGPGVAVAPPSRFGVLEVAKPHARQPLYEQLLLPEGRASARTLAQETVRALERQGRFEPGALLLARRTPEVAALAGPLVARLGPRFQVHADLGAGRENADIERR